ncbi:hypothetical protein STXM2123_3650 [Streptomyces sp. F-3]|nr:hypothetical protein STXM2123_3650 [Streptomyces sp. F-3]
MHDGTPPARGTRAASAEAIGCREVLVHRTVHRPCTGRSRGPAPAVHVGRRGLRRDHHR